MNLMSSMVLSVYFCSLTGFCFVNHPMGYCFLLLMSTGSLAFWSYLTFGLVWYVTLLCLVYMGGVYVLFVFIALMDPNPPVFQGGGKSSLVWVFWGFLMLLLGLEYFYPSRGMFECGRHLCGYMEGRSYLFLCFMLLFAFVMLSMASSSKDSFYR